MWCDPTRAAILARCARWLVLLVLPAVVAVAASAGGDAVPAGSATELKLPADIVYSRVPGSDSAVVFSHQSHAALEENHCTVCHPQPFRMLKRGPAPTHQEMNAQHSCGICHDGKKAFGVQDGGSCANCHSGAQARQSAAGGAAGAAPGVRKLPGPHAYPSGDSSPGKVTFRHEIHLKGAGSCTACHPKLFKMASSPPLPNGGMHEKTACGACHDGNKAFAAEDADSCTRCHRETGARP
jgi:c(7)-type cytochrome triheme protein